MTRPRLRVLVVEDSATVRAYLCDVLRADPGIEVVAVGQDGRQAIELCQALRPDVITLDMMLPTMTGLAATEYIMAHCPTPILIVSASTNRGELFKTYDALAAGAVDVLEKPSPDQGDASWETKFIATVKLVSRIKVITHPRARLGRLGQAERPAGVLRPSAAPTPRLAAIGVSTGGPAALVTVLNDLPAPLPFPILFVIHIAEAFGSAFAQWLEAQTGHRVSCARDGIAIPTGEVVMAPPNRHLVARDGMVRLTSDPERHSCRPSVDVLFESLAENGGGVVAALLTGMGRDGAAGLLKIRQAGGRTIAQDEASSVVYGMPREAVLLGAAELVLPLSQIGRAIALAAAGGEP